ncbi:AbrB family transcriptional regulator [Actibacterium ureilyticum]|uniref:AbrB family transcriptional regulator n=1 Tax=Actibacterium ureilyticum TaxID=1590614 RepID=UPI000BAAC900|nr:AbrB family transcriptional regulator [Actibacterium ureilyticum]
MSRPIPFTILLLTIGTLGGEAAFALSLPLPFMIGSLLASASVAILAPMRFPAGYVFPNRFRTWVITLVGAAIGAQVSPQVLSGAAIYIPSLLAILLFVPLSHMMGYRILRHAGGYDRADAFFGAAPGGFVESIALAEEAGADIRHVTMLHFLRIILVIVIVPFLMSLYLGHAVGSAQGARLGNGGFDAPGLAIAVGAAVAGYGLGQLLHLPARHMIGPILAAALLAGSGLAQPQVPGALVAAAQIVIGTSLGARFAGASLRMLWRAFGLSLLLVTASLLLGLLIAWILHMATGLATEALILSFTPGGVTEMALIALAISGNSAIVVAHHVLRIIATVLMMSTFLRRTDFLKKPG